MMNFDAIIFQYLETVERQLRDNKPVETGLTLRRLMDEGFSEKEAKYLIAQCVAVEMYEVMSTDMPYDEARYIKLLKSLPTIPTLEMEK